MLLVEYIVRIKNRIARGETFTEHAFELVRIDLFYIDKLFIFHMISMVDSSFFYPFTYNLADFLFLNFLLLNRLDDLFIILYWWCLYDLIFV